MDSSGRIAAGAVPSATGGAGAAGADELGNMLMTGASKPMISAFSGGAPGLFVTYRHHNVKPTIMAMPQ
ncbi:hypothetical protein QTI24_23540 [Variovorax sp. J22P240]|uniref:hypothetical protein n=1 Tax=Variovorax sp. J22P240 TaxID=3053514 RepID=UPI002575AB45|nr:hypothetical protein [Variovorax sp. J22P240]MDM0001599.1 hypothetical protein [Variovorax sp. J22P240]